MSSKADPNAKDPFTDESGFRYTAWLGLSFEEKRIAEGKGNWINEWPGGESHKKESLKKLAEQHKESTEKFKKSPHHEAARDVFGNAISRLKELKIDSAMFLGMASLTGQPQRVNVSRTAYGNIPMTELIAFESWVEILSQVFLPRRWLLVLLTISRDYGLYDPQRQNLCSRPYIQCS